MKRVGLLRRSILKDGDHSSLPLGVGASEVRPIPPVYGKNGKLYHAVCRFEIEETNQLPAPEIYLWCWMCHTGVATWRDILDALRR